MALNCSTCTAAGQSLLTPLGGLAVLAAALTWFQLKVEIGAERRTGTTEFEFRLTKQPADGPTLRALTAATTRHLLD
ncbi:hypothetical protein [Kitasatospora sp. NPDC004531]